MHLEKLLVSISMWEILFKLEIWNELKARLFVLVRYLPTLNVYRSNFQILNFQKQWH